MRDTAFLPTIYFVADLYEVDEENDTEKNLAEAEDSYNFLYPMDTSFWSYELENLPKGLAEYLDEEPSCKEVPAITWEVTKGNRCLFTCRVTEKALKKYGERKLTKLLEDYLNGQISDGWGENGLFMYHWMGIPPIVVNVRNLKKLKASKALEIMR